MTFCHIDCCLFETRNVVGINGNTLVQSAGSFGTWMTVMDKSITLVASIGDRDISYDAWQHYLLVGSRQSKKPKGQEVESYDPFLFLIKQGGSFTEITKLE
jgi:hypothetical protein